MMLLVKTRFMEILLILKIARNRGKVKKTSVLDIFRELFLVTAKYLHARFSSFFWVFAIFKPLPVDFQR